MDNKVLVEAWAIVEHPKTHKNSLTCVPMRDEDVLDANACAVYLKKEDAERVCVASTKGLNIRVVPCFVTYRLPSE